MHPDPITGRACRIVSIRHQVDLWKKVRLQSILTFHRIR
jgi:hypothetical protein